MGENEVWAAKMSGGKWRPSLPCPCTQCADSVNAPNHQNTIIVIPLQ
jgi:hypothetical protein